MGVFPRTHDVIVVGGGPSGVAAAVTSARLGARTLLLEQSERLGGTPVDGMHSFICGLYRNDPALPFDPLNRGIAMEIVSRLDRFSSEDGRRHMGMVEVHALRKNLYEQLLTELTQAEQGLTLAMRSRLASATVKGDAVASLAVEGDVSGIVSGGCFIDCTGQGDLIRLCGAAREPSASERQLAGFCLHISGIDDPEGLTPIKVPYHVRKAIDKGVLSADLRYTVFCREDGGTAGVCKLNLMADRHRNGAASVRELGDRVHRMLREEVGEFNRSVVDARSPRLLERTGRSLVGRYSLTHEDVLQGRRFSDGYIRAAWPVEFWDPLAGPTLEYQGAGASYEVPARCLQSSRLRNLFAAGRCISATARALSSVRVTGTCFALGEAAARVALGAGQVQWRENDKHS